MHKNILISIVLFSSLLYIFSIIPQSKSYEFSYGVSVGEVTANSAYFWARVDFTNYNVSEINNDTKLFLQLSFSNVFDTNTQFEIEDLPSIDNDSTIHYLVSGGLTSNTLYYYRFQIQNVTSNSALATSITGKFKTAPNRYQSTSDIVITFSGDSDGSKNSDGTPYFNNFEVLQQAKFENPDLFIYIGDTIYADSAVAQKYKGPDAVAKNITQFWNYYKENRNFTNLLDLLSNTSLLTTWDDHEVYNDWTQNNNENDTINLAKIGEEAFKDYWTIRSGFIDGVDPSVFTSVNWTAECIGEPMFRVIKRDNLDFFILDERSCRSKDYDNIVLQCSLTDKILYPFPLAPPNVQRDLEGQTIRIANFIEEIIDLGNPDFRKEVPQACIDALNNPDRTILGVHQRELFLQSLKNSTAKYKIIVTEVPMQELLLYPYDRFDGYPYERKLILRYIQDNAIENIIFLSADIHMNIINDVFINVFNSSSSDERSKSVGTEIIVGPIANFTPVSIVSFYTNDEIGALAKEVLQEYANDILENVHQPQCTNIDTYSYGVLKYSASSQQVTVEIKNDDGDVVHDDEDQVRACRVEL